MDGRAAAPDRRVRCRGRVVRLNRELVVEREFLQDWRFWATTNVRTALRLLDLVDAASRDPFQGIGKPEPLRHERPQSWSRRLTDGDRFIYRVEGSKLYLVSARGHYDR